MTARPTSGTPCEDGGNDGLNDAVCTTRMIVTIDVVGTGSSIRSGGCAWLIDG